MKGLLIAAFFITFGFFSGLASAHDRVDEIIKKSLARSQKAEIVRKRSENKIERLKRETGAECFTTTNDCARAVEVILSDGNVVRALKRISLRGVNIFVYYDNTEVMPHIGDAGGVFIPSDITIEHLKKYLGIQ